MPDPDRLARLIDRYPTDPDVIALAAETEERDIPECNRLLCEAHSTFWPGAGPSAAARLICTGMRRYFDTGWKFDRDKDAPPRDARRAYWWKILKADPRLLSERQVRRILGQKN